MSVLKNGQGCKVYKGDHKPVNLYQGDKKIAGWHEEQQCGAGPFVFERTFNDEVEMFIEGMTEQVFMPDKSLSFDGLDDYVKVSVPSLLEVNGVDKGITLECIAKANFRKLYDGFLFVGGRGGSAYGFLISLLNDDSYRVRYWSDGGTTIPFGTNEFGVYKHLTVTIENSIIKAYEDGVLKASHSIVNPIELGADLYIGTYWGDQNYLNGNISEVRVWDKALSQTEIEVNLFKRLTGIEDSLVGYWYLNEGEGTSAMDLIDGNYGVIDGATWSDDVPLMTNDIVSPDYPSVVKSIEVTNLRSRGKNILPYPLDLNTYVLLNYRDRTAMSQDGEVITVLSLIGDVLDTSFRFSSPYFKIKPYSTVTVSFEANVHSDTFYYFDTQRLTGSALVLVTKTGTRLFANNGQNIYGIEKNVWKRYACVITTSDEEDVQLILGSDSPNLYNYDSIEFRKLQIEYGDVQSEFKYYHEPAEIAHPELRKIGDIADSYDLVTGEHVQRIGIKVFEGTEYISLPTSTPPEGYIPFRYTTLMDSARPPFLCSHFPYKDENGYIQDIDKEYIKRWTLDSGQMFFMVQESRCSSIETFKNWLLEQYNTGAPVTVYYQLEEPIITYFDPAVIPTFPGATVIEQDGDVKGKMFATVKVMDQ